jgi:hypothetical protein
MQNIYKEYKKDRSSRNAFSDIVAALKSEMKQEVNEEFTEELESNNTIYRISDYTSKEQEVIEILKKKS